MSLYVLGCFFLSLMKSVDKLIEKTFFRPLLTKPQDEHLQILIQNK